MSEEKLIDHVVSRLEPQNFGLCRKLSIHEILPISYKSPLINTSERFMHRQIRDRGKLEEKTENNERYANNSRPQGEFNRFENQGSGSANREIRVVDAKVDNRIQPFHSQGGRQSGSREIVHFEGQK
ncbi:hypothetical protein TNCV_1452371 [Trichonephila clavipes]|nr:hypothetical protein TNCV_1452371 [Trichonephila clavipes]